MSKLKFVGYDALKEDLPEPKHAGYYVGNFLEKNKINHSQAAKMLGVNQSTVLRFVQSSSLTPNMAARLHNVFNMNITTLFQLDARYMAFQAKEIVAKNEALLDQAA